MPTRDGDPVPVPKSIGRYQILHVLGRGGMGVVYVAHDPNLDRRIALKVVAERLAENPEWRARFQREARILASLNHPNVAIIHSLEQEGALEFLTMEHIPGQSLAELIDANAVALPDALSIGRQIARGLHAAHASGVIHRDLKPQNVMVTPEGHVKVLDFGLASSARERAAGSSPSPSAPQPHEPTPPSADDETIVFDSTHPSGSRSGGSGTPGYMSPEQIRGDALDTATDAWAFGCVLFECLTGTRAFDGATPTDRLQQSMRGRPDLDQLPGRTPADVRALIESCLELNVSKRLANLATASEILDAALTARAWERVATPTKSATRDPETSGHPHNLPHQLSEFVGRSHEVAQIQDLLAANRLVTVTGVGGGGKTRVALRTGDAMLPSLEGGVWFVELAPLTEGARVVDAVARVLGLSDSPERSPLDAILHHVAQRPMLLILDNCEHLVEAAAGLASKLLASSSELRILATSRERLEVSGEAAYVLPPLELSTQAGDTFETRANTEAIQLFARRARLVRPDFALTESNIGQVTEICRRLDALPLAIELAAARVRVLSLADIARRLDDRFQLLRGAGRTDQARHQTLEAMIEWSHDHLTEGEQCLFRRLSIFQGGWSLEAAEEVCADEELASWEILDVLSRLIDRSLVVFTDGRYSMLETLREYAAARLAASDDLAALRSRFRNYMLELVRRGEAALRSPEQQRGLTLFDAEIDNVRAALAWALEVEDHQAAMTLSGCTLHYWTVRGLLREGRDSFQKALAVPGAEQPSKLRAIALNGLACFQLNLRELDGAGRRFQQAIDLLRELEMDEHVSLPLQNIANVYRLQGDLERSRAAYTEALASTDPENLRLLSTIHMNLGSLALVAEEYDEAIASYTVARQMQQQLGDRISEGTTLSHLGIAALRLDRLDEAKAYHLQSIAIFQEAGDRNIGPLADINAAGTLLTLGEYEEAQELLVRALHVVRDTGAVENIALALEVFGELARRRKQMTRAVTLLAASEQTRIRASIPRVAAEQRDWEANLAEARTMLDAGEFETCWKEGEALDQEAAIALALETGM